LPQLKGRRSLSGFAPIAVIGAHNKRLFVAAMCVGNSDRPPLAING
jgi:hypothetical protein